MFNVQSNENIEL